MVEHRCYFVTFIEMGDSSQSDHNQSGNIILLPKVWFVDRNRSNLFMCE